MSVMTATGIGLPTDRPLTVADLDLLPDDGNEYELDDGLLVVSPAPAINHQLVLTRLTAALEAARSYRQVAEVGGGEVFAVRRPFPVEIHPAALVAGPAQR